MDFNTTSWSLPPSRRRSIVAARIHVYRNAITEEQLSQLEQGGCDTSDIRLKLNSVVNETTSLLVDIVPIGEADLTKPGWIVFSNTAQLYEQWSTDASHRIRSLTIIANSPCNTEGVALNLGINHSAAFLVAFFNASLDFALVGGVMHAKSISKRTPQDEPRYMNETCQLHTTEVCFPMQCKT